MKRRTRPATAHLTANEKDALLLAQQRAALVARQQDVIAKLDALREYSAVCEQLAALKRPLRNAQALADEDRRERRARSRELFGL